MDDDTKKNFDGKIWMRKLILDLPTWQVVLPSLKCKKKVELHECQMDSKVKPMNIHKNTHTCKQTQKVFGEFI